MAVFLYVIFLGFWVFINFVKRGINAASFLLSIYFLSALVACFLLYNYDTYDPTEITIWAVTYHSVCLYLFLSPIIYFINTKPIARFKAPSLTGLNIIAMLIIVLSLLSLSNSIPKVISVFSFNDPLAVRVLQNQGLLHDDTPTGGVIGYLSAIGHHLSIYSLFLFFYYLTFHPKKKIFIAFLFISSFAIVSQNLSIMGRDGIVRWLFFFVFWFLFFKPHLPVSLKRRIIMISLIGSSPILVAFGIISFSRFGDRTFDFTYYIYDYIGQSFLNFSYFFNHFYQGAFGGRLTFPIFFPGSESVPMSNINDSVAAPFDLNVFSTFVGSFYLDLGFWKTLFLATMFYFSTFFLFKYLKKNRFTISMLFCFLIQVLLVGLFYFMFYSPLVIKINALFILLCFVIQVIFAYKPREMV